MSHLASPDGSPSPSLPLSPAVSPPAASSPSPSATTREAAPRLDGLDLARYLALAGMVLVNFRIVMASAVPESGWLQSLFWLLEGKAAGTFVMLAGMGFVLATRQVPAALVAGWTWRRAAFLMAVGLGNQLVFSADIIHYYAVYFVLALPWQAAGWRALLAGMVGVAGVSLAALLHLNYSQGWDWTTLSYAGFWTPDGFVRNLLFNGFHPVLPWLALFLAGMGLARLPLQRGASVAALMLGGAGALLVSHTVAALARETAWAWLLGTGPMPPGPVYLLTALGSGSLVIGACLAVARCWPRGLWRCLLPAGRMTLTLYLAHILLGMGTLEALGALDGTRSLREVVEAAALFMAAGTVLAWLWSRRWPQGPLEMLMRWMVGMRQQA